jgi:hypothetical protein
MHYLKKNDSNPVTGKPLKADDLFPIYFHKNAEGTLSSILHLPAQV